MTYKELCEIEKELLKDYKAPTFKEFLGNMDVNLLINDLKKLIGVLENKKKEFEVSE